MSGKQEIIKAVKAAFEHEPRINLHRFPIHIDFEDHVLTTTFVLDKRSHQDWCLWNQVDFQNFLARFFCFKIQAPTDGNIKNVGFWGVAVMVWLVLIFTRN